jgi:hypothetical protein
MSTPSTALEYLLLIRNTGWYKGFSPAERPIVREAPEFQIARQLTL